MIDLTHKLFTLSKVTNIFNKTHNLEIELQIDPLTQIYRKSYFDIALEKELVHNNNVALAVIDIDDFKMINDTYGHPIGDLVLKEFADTIKNYLRSDDIFARWGGEEFLILFKRTDANNALIITQKICKIIEDHNFHT